MTEQSTKYQINDNNPDNLELILVAECDGLAAAVIRLLKDFPASPRLEVLDLIFIPGYSLEALCEFHDRHSPYLRYRVHSEVKNLLTVQGSKSSFGLLEGPEYKTRLIEFRCQKANGQIKFNKEFNLAFSGDRPSAIGQVCCLLSKLAHVPSWTKVNFG